MGPFDNRLLAPLIRFALNKTAAIVVRDDISHKQVKRLGVSKPAIYLTGDAAFLLEPTTEETTQSILQRAGVDRTKPLIGINVSQLAASFSEKLRPKEGYLEIMTRLADYFVETYKATVILVPHGFPRRKMQTPASEDDFEAVNQVYGKINNKNYIIPLRAEYSAAELKGIIGQCHMFVGARMHSLIAAISCGVPTIGISYSLKTPGLMQMVGLEEYASDIRGVTFEEIREKADKVWAGKEQIREKLTKNAENIKQGVWLNGKLVRELLNLPQEIKG
jgi:polysaccharide pyruvyl transferase WcaK-like protein